MNKEIHLIVGSARQNRIADAIVSWIQEVASKRNDISLNIIDLKEENLPFFDAPIPPKYAADESDAAQKWAQKIAPTTHLLFLTPEYNGNISAVLKNAIDFLSKEWLGKTAGVISYGWGGGGKDAEKALNVSLFERLEMKKAGDAINIVFTPEMMGEGASFTNGNEELSDYVAALNTLFDQLSQ